MEGRALIGVKPTTPCVEWRGRKTRAGYGVVSRNGKEHYAHRAAYEEAYGSIPEGMEVCHACDNPACVNPEHLWVGSHADNMRDIVLKGRSRRGERSPLARFTAAQVLAMRALSAEFGETLAELSARFGAPVSTISQIVRGAVWAHLPGAVSRAARAQARKGATGRAYVRDLATVPRGETSGVSKLTEADVREIRRLAEEGVSYAEIGRRFAITRTNAAFVAKGKTWSHVH